MPARLQLRMIPRALRKCAYCGVMLFPHSATVDHVVPKGRGGTDRLSNLALACRGCNAAKGSRTVAQFGRRPAATLDSLRRMPDDEPIAPVG